MSHFVCTGDCGGASEKPGTCQAPECNKKGDALTECGCTDGEHGNLPDESSRAEAPEK